MNQSKLITVSRIKSEPAASAKLPMLMMGLASDNGHFNGRDLDVAADHSLFATIVTPLWTVELSVYIDLDWGVLVRITCNGAVKRVPGGTSCTGGLESEGVWLIWSHI